MEFLLIAFVAGVLGALAPCVPPVKSMDFLHNATPQLDVPSGVKRNAFTFAG